MKFNAASLGLAVVGKGRVRIRNRPHFFPFCYMAYVYVIFSLHTIFHFSVMIRGKHLKNSLYRPTWFEATPPPPLRSETQPNFGLANSFKEGVALKTSEHKSE
jgi:hypothetical protein